MASMESADAIEAERQRLAALLDANIINPLDLLLAQAAAYEQAFATVPEVQLTVSALSALARQVRQHALTLQDNLRPVVLEVAGLDVALEMLAPQFSRDTGIQVELKIVRANRDRLPAALELALFRVVQDALASLQQVGATRVELQLVQTASGSLTMHVRDNGRRDIPRSLLNDTIQRIESLLGTITIQPAEIQVRIQFTPPARLTNRERDVVGLVIEGLTNKEIAQQLNLSERTINFHLNNVYSKLQVSTRTEAVVYALRTNLLE